MKCARYECLEVQTEVAEGGVLRMLFFRSLLVTAQILSRRNFAAVLCAYVGCMPAVGGVLCCALSRLLSCLVVVGHACL